MAVAVGALAVAASAQAPAYNRPPPPPPPMGVPATGAAANPPLLSPDAPHEAVTMWLWRNAPSSRGRSVYINGEEAF